MENSPVSIREATRMIRSRNAGSFLISIDFVFHNRALYEIANQMEVFDRQLIATAYALDLEDVAVIPHDPSCAIKVTIPRSVPSGDPRDTDIDSSQQYVPLLDLELPAEARSKLPANHEGTESAAI